MIRIAVIDGQGASIGSTIIRKIRRAYGEKVEIWALGTNAIATGQMMKASANRGATGESAVTHCAGQVDVIIGPISILVSNAMMGEVTPRMVQAIGDSKAVKLLLPLTSEPITVVGVAPEPLPHLVDRLVGEHLFQIVRHHECVAGGSSDAAGPEQRQAQSSSNIFLSNTEEQ